MADEQTATATAGPEDFAEFEKWRETGEMPESKEPEKAAPATDPEKSGESETAPATEPEKKQEGEPEGEVPEGVQKRIDKAVRRQREAERRAEAAEVELERLRTPEAKPVPVEGKPKVSDFTDYDEYVEALAEWKTEQKFAAERSTEQQSRAAAARRTAAATFAERVKEAATKPEYADIGEVLDSDVTVSAAMHDVLLESEKGAELAYYLGKHPEESARISRLSPISAARELGKIEASLAKPPEPAKPRASAAPAPMKPVGGKSVSVNMSDPDMPYEEWERHRNAELKARGL